MTDRTQSDQPLTNLATQPHGHLVKATPTQVLTGLSLPTALRTPTPHVRCTVCDTQLRAGATIIAPAYRLTQTREWVIPRVYCRRCGPTTCPQPTRGAVDVLVTGTLATISDATTQTHALCLTELEPIASSPATTGSRP